MRCDFLTCQDPKFPQHILAAAEPSTYPKAALVRQSAFAEFFPSVFKKKTRVPTGTDGKQLVIFQMNRGLALVPKTRKKSCPTKRRPSGTFVFTTKSIQFF